MRSNGLPPEDELPFKLGDVVLCRYSSYPYWPATVDQTHQERFKGKYCTMMPTRGGDKVLAFWCTFANDDTGGWVRADRMVLFHPALLDRIRVAKNTEWHSDQKEAIESTLKSFAVIHKGEPGKVPQAPTDMKTTHQGSWDSTADDDILSDDEAHPQSLEEDEDPMDLGDSEDGEEGVRPTRRQSGRHSKKAGKSPARPKAKKEPRKSAKRKSIPAEEPRPKKRAKGPTKLEKDLLDNVDNDPEEPRRKGDDRDVGDEVIERSGKRRRHSYSHPGEPSKKMRRLEAELANAKEIIASLKKSLKKKEKSLSELTGNGAGVACAIPPLPPPLEEALPVREKYRSIPVNSKKFNKMMDTLSDDYEVFKKAATSADEARTDLEQTMEKIKKLYNEACDKVAVAEDVAAKKELRVVNHLREILEADVQVQNLRERKAGHVVRAMLKKCKDMPAIRDFCDAIYKSWKSQVVDYMKDNEGKLNQESPSGAKSSGGKSERKNADSPSANEKTPPKDKAKAEETDESPVKKEPKPNSEGTGNEIKGKDIDARTSEKEKESAKASENEGIKEKAKAKENQKGPRGSSEPKAEGKDAKTEADKGKRPDKDSKPDDKNREEKPQNKEAPEAKTKSHSDVKVEEKDRPPAKE